MALQCGIVGLPNVGKSTLFNCLSNAKAQSANFPSVLYDRAERRCHHRTGRTPEQTGRN